MDVEPTVSLSLSLLPTSTPFVLLQERKREPRVISGRENGVFLSLMLAGRRDDDRVLQLNEAKKDAEDEGGGCSCR